MRQTIRSFTYLWSFGKLLQRLRGSTALQTIADQCGVAEPLLRGLEQGRQPIDETLARHVLSRGFGMQRSDVAKAILGIKLYDLGLRDNELRQLTIDIITKSAPAGSVDAVRSVYRKYAA